MARSPAGVPITTVRPILRAGGSPDVAVGFRHSCALRTDDAVVCCWGDNSDGQLNAPAGRFTDISVGEEHSCALRTDGTVVCWNFPQIAPAPAGVRVAGVAAAAPPGRRGDPEGAGSQAPFSAVAVGTGYGCGLRTDRSVDCWGENTRGQADAPGGEFSAIAAGWSHSCGVRAGGEVVCWGDNDEGKAEAPGGQFTAVTGGWRHSCGVRSDDSVDCWGDNSEHQSSPPEGRFNSVRARPRVHLRTDDRWWRRVLGQRRSRSAAAPVGAGHSP